MVKARYRLGLRPALAAGVALAALIGAPVQGRSQAGDPIKIGFVTELTGPWSFYGSSCLQGAKLAEKAINGAGGILGRPLQLIVADDRTIPTDAVAAARRLDDKDHVVAIAGPTNSDAVMAIYGYTEANKLPFIASTGTPQVTKPGSRYTFRIYTIDNVGLGAANAKFIADQKPRAKVAVLYSDFSFMRSVVAGFDYEAKRQKIDVVYEAAFPLGSNDATVKAAQALVAKPDYVLVLGIGAFDNTLSTQLLDVGFKPEQLIHPYAITTSILGWGKRSIGSIYGTQFDVNQDAMPAAGRTFIADFTKEYGHVPTYTEMYCNFVPYLIKQAVEKAGSTDREKLRAALSAIDTTMPAIGWHLEFDANGAPKTSSYSFMRITDVGAKDYKSKQIAHLDWNPSEIPIYRLSQ